LTNSLVLLSGEKTSIPEAEARALFLAYDPNSTFAFPEERVIIVKSSVVPETVSRRIAFSRRVGALLSSPSDAAEVVKGKKVRFRSFSLRGRPEPRSDFDALLRGLQVSVDLEEPDYEFTRVSGRGDYLILSTPANMMQDWSSRRPRRRPFFHPAAIFPKLSRALVNLTQCKEGETLLDPFVGTGSIPIEASEVGLSPVAIDRSRRMANGALSNMRAFGQSWPGVIRGDAFSLPIVKVDGIATDMPYGRASSAGGKSASAVLSLAVERLPGVLKTGGRLVLMHPSHVPIDAPGELRVEEEHYIYIHRKLTRAITILRKT